MSPRSTMPPTGTGSVYGMSPSHAVYGMSPSNSSMFSRTGFFDTGPGGFAGGSVVIEPHSGCACGTPGCGGEGACCIGGPGAACGGILSPCCQEAGSIITQGDWEYVGPGRGNFEPNSASYAYAGKGKGNYTKEVVATPYGCRPKPCCAVLSVLLLFCPLLVWYSISPVSSYVVTTRPGGASSVVGPSPAPPVPPNTGPVLGNLGTCTIWGDPHIRTFDGMRSDYYSPGEYWLVRNDQVWIQARYLPTKATNGLAVTKVVAVAGPFLKGHKFHVSAQWATWDGQKVLTDFPSDFAVAGLTEMHFNDKGITMQRGRTGKPLRVVHARFADGSPEGLLLQVNRWTEPSEGNYINVQIQMRARPGQDGHCGNFDGNRANDDRLKVRERVGKNGVSSEELLFASKTPITKANHPDVNNCHNLEEAKATCQTSERRSIPSMACLVDVCFGGKHFATES